MVLNSQEKKENARLLQQEPPRVRLQNRHVRFDLDMPCSNCKEGDEYLSYCGTECNSTDLQGVRAITAIASQQQFYSPKDFWLTKEELLQNVKAAIRDKETFIQDRPQYKKIAEQLLGLCIRTNLDCIMFPADDLLLRCDSIMLDYSHASIRGLETFLSPLLQIRRRYVIQTFLATQAKSRELQPNQRLQMLAHQYHQSSRYAATWARVMAYVDYQLVVDE